MRAHKSCDLENYDYLLISFKKKEKEKLILKYKNAIYCH